LFMIINQVQRKLIEFLCLGCSQTGFHQQFYLPKKQHSAQRVVGLLAKLNRPERQELDQ
jgi:hypothetical protein